MSTIRTLFIVGIMVCFTRLAYGEANTNCQMINDKLDRTICLLEKITNQIHEYEKRIERLEFYVYIIGGTVGVTFIAIIKDSISRYINNRTNGNGSRYNPPPHERNPWEAPRKK